MFLENSFQYEASILVFTLRKVRFLFLKTGSHMYIQQIWTWNIFRDIFYI